jgi:predicted outer membrane repeat protein
VLRLLPVVLLFLPAPSASARTWLVDPYGTGDAPTIAAAMDSCVSGDSVLVHPGTYYEHDVDVVDGVTLRSTTGDCGSVTIDATELGRVLRCVDVGVDTRIECLVLRGGSALDGPLPEALGGGILCSNASPVIAGCEIRDCRARFGAALGITGGDPTVIACTFRDNEGKDPLWAAGGAVYVHESSAMFLECLFEGNVARSVSLAGDGGAVFCDASRARVLACTFRGNEAGVGGGALYSFDDDEARISGCLFEENDARAGGAAYLETSSAEIRDCRFDGNTANNGGAVFIGNISHPAIHGCTFEGNSSLWGGGAIDSRGNYVETSGCVFLGNSAGTFGGALQVGIGGSFELAGAVLHGNSATYGGGAVRVMDHGNLSVSASTFHAGSAPSGGGLLVVDWSNVTVDRTVVAFSAAGEGVACDEYSDVALSCSDLFGNLGGDWVGSIAGQATQNDNLCADPEFCDRTAGDLDLAPGSPCLPDGNRCEVRIGALGPGCLLVPVPERMEVASWARVKERFRTRR